MKLLPPNTGIRADRPDNATRPPAPRSASSARLMDTLSAPLRLGYLITGIAALCAATLIVMLIGRETVAVVVLGGMAVFVLAIRRISAVVLTLIPVMVLSSEPLHKALPATILVGVLAFAGVILFCVGTLRVRPSHLSVVVLGAMVLIGYYFPANRLAPTDQTLSIFLAVLAGLVVVTICIASPPTASVLLKVILVTGAVVGVVASVQGQYAEGRLQGFGTNPNGLAVYLAAPIVISIGIALHRRNPIWLAPGALCIPALLASQSREGFLAAVAGTGFLIVQHRSRIEKAVIIGVIGVLVAFPGYLTALASLGAGNRSAVALANNNTVRAQVGWFAAHTALGHPLLGVGLGQFPYYAAASGDFGLYITTTNEYLQLASETGLISLAAFLALLWFAVKDRRCGDMAIVRAVVIAYAVSMLFIDSFETSLVALPFWACLGVLLAERKPADD